jgi:plasmid stabilization system protein ParE
VRVVWSPSALQDIINIYNYVANYNPGAASGVIDALLAAGDSLVNLPNRGRPVGDNLRELAVVYPYIIRYEVLGNDVTILRVRHGMRRP